MPRIIGIDEAGYGPMLGPLTVSSAAFDVPGDDPTIDLWTLLRKSVCRTKRGASRRLLVADSKVVYAGGQGLDALERAVLAFLAAAGQRPATFRRLLDELCADSGGLCADAWWSDVNLPAASDAALLDSAAALVEDGQPHARFLGLAAQVVNPGPFNTLMARHRNKSVVLFQQNMILIERAMARYDGDLHFLIDKHGGRHYYAELLSNNFFGSAVHGLSESPESSSYEVRLPGRTLRLTFMEKAERRHLPVALASMTCKYLRELFMIGFNAYWCGRVQGLEPTAGYHTDGTRFVAAIRPLIKPHAERDIIRER